MSLRCALIWSLFAHGFLFVWFKNEVALDGGSPVQQFVVELAAQAPQALEATSKPRSLSTLPAAARTLSSTTPQERVAVKQSGVTPSPQREPPETLLALPGNLQVSNSSPVANAEGLRNYRLALAREARRGWQYPQQAMTENWQGTTDIRIELLTGGRLLAARIERSSGYAVLDEAALKIMSNAATSAQVPASLAGDPLSIVVPVKFSLPGAGRSSEN